MSLERLPGDDLPVTKPEGACALTLVSDFARLDPPDSILPESDHDVPFCDEAFWVDARLHIFRTRFEPGAYRLEPGQSRPAGGLQFNLEVVQREKFLDLTPIPTAPRLRRLLPRYETIPPGQPCCLAIG